MRGCYRDPWYGDIANEKKGDGLGVRFTHTPALTGNLEHWQQDTFVARWATAPCWPTPISLFSLNPDCTIERAQMRAVSPLTGFSFDLQDMVLKPVAKNAAPY